MAREIGNPPQLWKTYQALGALYERQADLERARTAYQSAMDVIDGVARGYMTRNFNAPSSPLDQCKRYGNAWPRPAARGLEMSSERTGWF